MFLFFDGGSGRSQTVDAIGSGELVVFSWAFPSICNIKMPWRLSISRGRTWPIWRWRIGDEEKTPCSGGTRPVLPGLSSVVTGVDPGLPVLIAALLSASLGPRKGRCGRPSQTVDDHESTSGQTGDSRTADIHALRGSRFQNDDMLLGERSHESVPRPRKPDTL